MLHPVLGSKLNEVKNILKQNNVLKAYAFGSVCTDKFNDESDIDLLVNFDPKLDPLSRGEKYWIIEESLQQLLNRSIDIVSEASLTNPYFIKVLNKTKTVIYE